MNNTFEVNSSRPRARVGGSLPPIVMVLFLIVLAIVATSNALSGEYGVMMFSVVLAGVTAHFSGLWRYYWIFAIAIGFSRVMMAPAGFVVTADFFVTGACALIFSVGISHLCLGQFKNPLKEIPSGATLLVATGLIFLLYLFFQGFIGMVDPVYPADYSFRNSIKLYVEDSLPILVFLMLWPVREYLPKGSSVLAQIGFWLLFTMVALIVLRGYEFMTGMYDPDNTEANAMKSTLVVPVIKMFPNVFALRSTSVMASVYGAVLWQYASARMDRKLCYVGFILIVIGILGSVMSGGRGVIILCVGGMIMVTWFYGKHIYLVTGIIAALILVTLVNIAGPVIDTMPYYMRRSVAMLRFEESAEKRAIAGSSDMREWVYTEGMSEWRSDTRIMLTGRGTLAFTETDLQFNTEGNEQEKWMSAVRTGRLHKTIANLLIRYGVIGAMLYMVFLLCWFRFIYKHYRRSRSLKEGPEAEALSVFVLVISIIGLVMMMMKDSPMEPVIVLLGVIALSMGPKTNSTEIVKRANVS